MYIYIYIYLTLEYIDSYTPTADQTKGYDP